MAPHWPWHGWHPCCHPVGHWLERPHLRHPIGLALLVHGSYGSWYAFGLTFYGLWSSMDHGTHWLGIGIGLALASALPRPLLSMAPMVHGTPLAYGPPLDERSGIDF